MYEQRYVQKLKLCVINDWHVTQNPSRLKYIYYIPIASKTARNQGRQASTVFQHTKITILMYVPWFIINHISKHNIFCISWVT